ncbi:MAG: tetratricopeptide repeat protein, partial [Planctomycetota bacterium]
LFLPLLFAAPLLGGIPVRLPRPLRVGLFLLLVLLAWSRGAVYRDRESYQTAVIDSVPRDVAAWNDLGLARLDRGDIDGAIEAWNRGLAIDPRYSRLWSNLGAHQMRSGDFPRAAVTLERAVEEGPNNPIAHCNLGHALLRLGHHARAARAYERATQLAPGMSPAWRGLAHALHAQGRRDEAGSALEHALALDPADPLAQRLRETITGEAAPPRRD